VKAPSSLGEQVAKGEEPSGLSLERMTKRVPMMWEEQRERLGLPNR
jgi:hypothetical protein